MTNRFIALILSLIMTVSAFPLISFAADLKWPSDYGLGGLEMPFTPADKYVTHQNPPDFAWSSIKEASSYDLIICRDKELTDIAYEKRDLKLNLFNFDKPFEIGTYYWSVRYKSGSSYSEWSPARRFRISPDAVEFPVPDADTLAERIPESHPRIWMGKGIEHLRNYAKTERGKYLIDLCQKYIDENINLPLEPEPKWEDYPDANSKFYNLRGDVLVRANKQMTYGAFLYLINGDVNAGNYAKKVLLNVASWDPEGVTSYTSQDQVHREITYRCAITYDWIYDLLSEDERKKVEEMVSARTKTMSDDLVYSNVTIADRPYESHGQTAFGYMLVIAIAMYKNLPEMEKLFKDIILTYINNYPAYSYEDGGFSQGTFYYKASTASKGFVVDLLNATGIINMYDKAWSRAEETFFIYQWPTGSVGAFGDGSYQSTDLNEPQKESRLASIYKSGEAKWKMHEIVNDHNDLYTITDSVFDLEPFLDIADGYDDVEITPPYTWDKGRRYKDIGWASMHSDLTDQNRISLFFKSSPYGSYNHSHADQNSFVIQAFGERLAIDSGYYAYGTDWENKYVRQTFAHNGITIDGGKGQIINYFNSKGYLTEHITSADFDMVKGEAAEAYGGLLNKADRYIVYVRPDTYVVIDDLETANKKGSNYEFWINALKDCISVYEDNSGARVKKNSAVLDARVQYPQKITPKYSNTFSGATLIEVPRAPAYVNHDVQQRVWFETDKLKSTKMVTTLDVHKENENPQNIRKTSYKNYIKLEFENGTVMYVKTDNSDIVDCGDIKFSGAAYIENGNAYMLVSGNYLEKSGKEILKSDVPVSVELGRNIINISAADDAEISLNVPGVETITDEDGRVLGAEWGITCSLAEDNALFDLDKGDYTLVLNNARCKPTVSKTTVPYTYEGNTSPVEADKVIELDGTYSIHGRLNNEANKYYVAGLSRGMNIYNASVGDIVYLDANARFNSYNNEKPYIILEKVDIPLYPHTERKDYDTLKSELDVLIEAENYTDKTGIPRTYNTRTFLSGGAGLSQIYDANDSASYEFDIPEDGYYDLCVKGVAWVEGTARTFIIDSHAGMFGMPTTPGYGTTPDEWTSEVVSTKLYLTAGTHKMKIEGLNNFSNFDWFGFKKSE